MRKMIMKKYLFLIAFCVSSFVHGNGFDNLKNIQNHFHALIYQAGDLRAPQPAPEVPYIAGLLGNQIDSTREDAESRYIYETLYDKKSSRGRKAIAGIDQAKADAFDALSFDDFARYNGYQNSGHSVLGVAAQEIADPVSPSPSSLSSSTLSSASLKSGGDSSAGGGSARMNFGAGNNPFAAGAMGLRRNQRTNPSSGVTSAPTPSAAAPQTLLERVDAKLGALRAKQKISKDDNADIAILSELEDELLATGKRDEGQQERYKKLVDYFNDLISPSPDQNTVVRIKGGRSTLKTEALQKFPQQVSASPVVVAEVPLLERVQGKLAELGGRQRKTRSDFIDMLLLRELEERLSDNSSEDERFRQLTLLLGYLEIPQAQALKEQMKTGAIIGALRLKLSQDITSDALDAIKTLVVAAPVPVALPSAQEVQAVIDRVKAKAQIRAVACQEIINESNTEIKEKIDPEMTMLMNERRQHGNLGSESQKRLEKLGSMRSSLVAVLKVQDQKLENERFDMELLNEFLHMVESTGAPGADQIQRFQKLTEFFKLMQKDTLEGQESAVLTTLRNGLKPQATAAASALIKSDLSRRVLAEISELRAGGATKQEDTDILKEFLEELEHPTVMNRSQKFIKQQEFFELFQRIRELTRQQLETENEYNILLLCERLAAGESLGRADRDRAAKAEASADKANPLRLQIIKKIKDDLLENQVRFNQLREQLKPAKKVDTAGLIGSSMLQNPFALLRQAQRDKDDDLSDNDESEDDYEDSKPAVKESSDAKRVQPVVQTNSTVSTPLASHTPAPRLNIVQTGTASSKALAQSIIQGTQAAGGGGSTFTPPGRSPVVQQQVVVSPPPQPVTVAGAGVAGTDVNSVKVLGTIQDLIFANGKEYLSAVTFYLDGLIAPGVEGNENRKSYLNQVRVMLEDVQITSIAPLKRSGVANVIGIVKANIARELASQK